MPSMHDEAASVKRAWVPGGPYLDRRTSASQAHAAVAARLGDIGDFGHNVGHAAGALRAAPSARLACGHAPAPAHAHEERKALYQLQEALPVQRRVNALLSLPLLVWVV